MLKRKTIKWSILAAIVGVTIATYEGWILWPWFFETPYYRIDRGSQITRVANGRQAHIRINENAYLRLMPRCPSSENWYVDRLGYDGESYNRNCSIRIYLEGKFSMQLRFSSRTQTLIEDISQLKKPLRIDATVKVRNSAKAASVYIEFEDEVRPIKFRLHIPDVIIDGKPHKVPVITGDYVENIEFIPPSFNM